MRILVFSTDDFLPPAGGAEIAFGQIAKQCPDISFDLICARLRRTSSRLHVSGNVTIHRIGIGVPWLDRILLALCGAPVALFLHRRHRFDLVWAILASYGAFAALAVKKITGLPFLLTLQEGTDTWVIERRTRSYRPLFRNIFQSADALSAISSYLLAWGKRMGFRGFHARIVPNGVDYERFHSAVGAPHSGMTIISISRFVHKNGLEDLIAALALLPEHIRLILVGDGPLRSQLEHQVVSLGLIDRVKMVGFVPHEDTPALLKSADIFIRPSISEGLGNAFLEAMAAGLMVVGTPVGGIVDFLVDGQTGFVCQPHNPTSIAHAIERIIALDESSRATIRDTAAAMVRERFTWDRIATDMRALFHTLCPTR